jgi:hypothetical protein
MYLHGGSVPAICSGANAPPAQWYSVLVPGWPHFGQRAPGPLKGGSPAAGTAIRSPRDCEGLAGARPGKEPGSATRSG